jgi:all-trans-8'-apo-beta-carotenal 15,15'-oxygenase
MPELATPPHPLHRTLSRPHGYEPLTVQGHIPEGLEGTLLRAGPGVFERFGRRLTHPFEADGAITAVRFRAEQAANQPLYGSTAPWWRRFTNGLRGKAKTTGNTSVLQWQGRLFALMEGALPQEFRRADLQTLEATDLGGLLHRTFSAHPHRIAKKRTTINFGLRYERTMHVDLFELPDRGAPRRIGSFEAPWMAMLHDFAVTESHAVFVIGPARLVFWRAVLGSADFGKLFQWRPELGVQVVVVPLDAPDRPRRIELDPFWAWHLGNAYEEADGTIKLDMCRYDDFGSLDAIAAPESDLSPPLLHTVVIERDDTVHIEQMWDQLCEFPRIHPDLAGRKHATVWMQSEVDGAPGITRFDLGTRRAATWEAPAGHLVSEPVPVPKSASSTFQLEHQVWVLSVVLDTTVDRSYVAVLDGERPSAGPVCTAWFDQPLPLTFHGTWVPRGTASVS